MLQGVAVLPLVDALVILLDHESRRARYSGYACIITPRRKHMKRSFSGRHPGLSNLGKEWQGARPSGGCSETPGDSVDQPAELELVEKEAPRETEVDSRKPFCSRQISFDDSCDSVASSDLELTDSTASPSVAVARRVNAGAEEKLYGQSDTPVPSFEEEKTHEIPKSSELDSIERKAEEKSQSNCPFSEEDKGDDKAQSFDSSTDSLHDALEHLSLSRSLDVEAELLSEASILLQPDDDALELELASTPKLKSRKSRTPRAKEGGYRSRSSKHTKSKPKRLSKSSSSARKKNKRRQITLDWIKNETTVSSVLSAICTEANIELAHLPEYVAFLMRRFNSHS